MSHTLATHMETLARIVETDENGMAEKIEILTEMIIELQIQAVRDRGLINTLSARIRQLMDYISTQENYSEDMNERRQ